MLFVKARCLCRDLFDAVVRIRWKKIGELGMRGDGDSGDEKWPVTKHHGNQKENDHLRRLSRRGATIIIKSKLIP